MPEMFEYIGAGVVIIGIVLLFAKQTFVCNN